MNDDKERFCLLPFAFYLRHSPLHLVTLSPGHLVTLSLAEQPAQRTNGRPHAVWATEAPRAAGDMQVWLERQEAAVAARLECGQQLGDGAVALAGRAHRAALEEGILDVDMGGVVSQQRPGLVHRPHADLHKV